MWQRQREGLDSGVCNSSFQPDKEIFSTYGPRQTPGTTSCGVQSIVPFCTNSSSGWRVETINEHVAQVRGMYLDTLAHWPGRPVPPAADSPDSADSKDGDA